MAPPANVAAPIVNGGEAAGGQKRLGPVMESKSIVVVAAVAPTAEASVNAAATTTSKAIRETPKFTTPFLRAPVSDQASRCRQERCPRASARPPPGFIDHPARAHKIRRAPRRLAG